MKYCYKIISFYRLLPRTVLHDMRDAFTFEYPCGHLLVLHLVTLPMKVIVGMSVQAFALTSKRELLQDFCLFITDFRSREHPYNWIF